MRITKRTRPAITATLTALSVGYAVVVATGLLTLGLGIVASLNHASFVEYYQYVFPHYRGGGPTRTDIPAFGYVAFVIYIVVAAVVAVNARKRMERAWSRRQAH